MTRKTSIILILLFIARTSFAFEYVGSFVEPRTRFSAFLSRVAECKLDVSCYKGEKLGAFTEITTATVISSFPVIYNANLNITVEVGTSSIASILTLSNLATVGTITTGVWNGSTTATAYGGTGSSTLPTNQILVGNRTGSIKNVPGFGASGQFLTSNGDGAMPTWQTSAVSLSDNYTWTGIHSFTAALISFTNATTSATTTVESLTASAASSTGPLTLNGVPYGFPSQLPTNASGTILSINQNGAVSFIRQEWELLAETITSGAQRSATATLMMQGATSTRKDLTVIVDIPGVSTAVDFSLNFNADYGSNYGYQVGTTSAASSAGTIILAGSGQGSLNSAMAFFIDIVNNTSLRKYASWRGVSNAVGGASAPKQHDGAGVWNNTAQQIDTIEVTAVTGTLNSGTRISVYGSRL